jgi:hypothetical protein
MQQGPIALGTLIGYNGPFMNFKKRGVPRVGAGPHIDFLGQYDCSIIEGKTVPFLGKHAASDADEYGQNNR